MACCFDAGDCEIPVNGICNTCQHPNVAWVGDGYCDKMLFDEGINCCWDLNDCMSCLPTALYGQSSGFGTLAMSMCRGPEHIGFQEVSSVEFFNTIVQCAQCPTLVDVEKCPKLSDGTCDHELMNFDGCFDMGDCWCPRCQAQDWHIRLGKLAGPFVIRSSKAALCYVFR